MKNTTATRLFPSGGLLLSPEKTKTLPPAAEVIPCFEKEGLLVFRGFGLAPEALRGFTDQFTESYARDAYRREPRFGQAPIRNVDLGTEPVLLHSEASFTPAWPEIIWFYCVRPPQKGGQTTICDGIAVWNALSLDAKNFFLRNPIRYDLKIPTGQKLVHRTRAPWLLNTLGAADAVMDWENGNIELTQVRWAVTEGRVARTLCFANHLIIELDSEPQLLGRTLLDGSPVPESMMREIKAVTTEHTQELNWQAGDLVMLDNHRFMHGRRAVAAQDQRDIVVIQTARASFGYGATTRQKLTSSLPPLTQEAA